MKMSKFLVAWLVAMSVAIGAMAQATGVFTDAQLAYKEGMNLYQQGVYDAAQAAFGKVLEAVPSGHQAPYNALRQEAGLRFAQCAVRLNHPDGEKLIRDFIRDNSPSALANQARRDMGNYYFEQKKYDEALAYYQEVPMLDLNNDEITELKFKMGYALLVRKNYDQAKNLFKQIKDIQGEYYDGANYYYGITAFQSQDYDGAIASFERVTNSRKYSKEVPYYICQIAFAKKDYDKVIEYGEPKAKDSTVKKYNEINQLVGQAYFEKGKFDKALPFLEEFAKSKKLRQEDLYQVAYTQYRVGRYKAAIDNFEELKNLNSKLGQNALYNLGDCNLKVGDRRSARNAFKKASTMTFDDKIQSESQFLYSKLSYELKFDNDAIEGLQKIPTNSPYYVEAQELLSQLFVNTRNYKRALEIMDGIPNKSLKMREAYQQVAYYRGVQIYNDNDGKAAKELFVKSLKDAIDQRVRALAHYWIGEIDYVLGDYTSSINNYNQFLTIQRTIPSAFTDEANVHTTNYALGYIHLKKEDYKKASKYFKDAIEGFEGKLRSIDNDYVKTKIYPDALLRAGDCNIKENQYPQALTYYNKVINNKFSGADYALFQKAIILGLQKKDVEKILAMEDLAYKNAQSEYADDALLDLGVTYTQLGKYDEANKHLKKLVTDYKNKSDLINAALLQLGLIAYNQDQTDRALDYYKQVFSNNPNSAEAKDALRGIEEIYLDKGEPEKYFAFLESIPGYKISDAAKDSLSYKTAETQYRNGEYEKAAKSYSSYLLQFPKGRNALDAYFQRAESYFILKRYPESLADYENIINRGNNTYYARSLKKAANIAYNGLKDFNQAYNFYLKWEGIATGTDLYEAKLGKLRSAFRLGNRAAEVYSLAEYVKANVSATALDKGEAAYYTGKTAFAENRYDKARAAFTEAISYMNNEEAAEARYLIAVTHFKNKDYNTAEQLCLNYFQELQDYADWLARTIILLADIYTQKGDIFNAQASLESVVENYQGDPTILQEAKDKLDKIKKLDNSGSRLAPPTNNSGDLEMEEDGGN